jgi:hypothetical protein
MGTHFRDAELWEVGVYLLIPHHSDEQLCPTLRWNRDLLGGFQDNQDGAEQADLLRHAAGMPTGFGYPDSQEATWEHVREGPDGETGQEDGEDDGEFERVLDRLYHERQDPDGLCADYQLEEQELEDDAGPTIPMPSNYMPPQLGEPVADPDQMRPRHVDTEHDRQAPRTDALNNPYVRVVHTNGIHHISTVFCTCRGRENTHCDMMAARLIPTSFIRYRTMFTHAVLDDFRVTNLECKASAYQYFQKLRRETSRMSPENVPNLYHELRRMSRLWRWMKKLKWAGVHHDRGDHMSPKSGTLANFCPACPQPGINLPASWESDQNK